MDDERRRQIIVLVAVLSVLRSLLAECVDSCGEFLLQQFRGVVAALDGRGQRNPPTVWTFNRPNLFLESTLLASYNDAAFKSRMRVCPSTFEYLCRLLAPDLKKNDTQMRKAVSVDKRISLALSRLATGNLLKDIGDTFGVGTTTVQRAVMEFCVAVEKRLKPLCIKWPHPSRMEKLASEFEALRGIPLVVGAIDGSYLPIIAPFKNPQDYYNRKGFHAVILQLIVSAKKYIWDYDVGWCGSMHDSNVLKHSGAGVRIRDGHLGVYTLVGDAAYATKPWMLSPYKGSKQGLDRMQYFWNFIQSSTRMPVECAIGELKARFRILMKRNDSHLKNLPEIVGACCVLHNLCLAHGDKFDPDWINEPEQDLQKALQSDHDSLMAVERVKNSLKQCRLDQAEIAKASAYSLHRLRNINSTPMEIMAESLQDSEDPTAFYSKLQKHSDSERRDALAKVLFEQQKDKLVLEVFGENSSDE